MAAVIGVVVTLLGVVFAGPVVRLLGAGPDIEDLAESYLRIRVLSAGAVLVAQVGHGWLRGTQNTKTPMVIAVGGALLNVVLDYLFIYTFGMGVQGAAWATVIGQYVAAAAFLLILTSRFNRGGAPWRFEREVARGLLKIGADLVVRTGALLGALTLTTSVAARMSLDTLGAWQITMQLFLFLSLVMDSVAIAAQALIGKHLGAGTRTEARIVSIRLMEWGLLIGLGAAVVLYLGPERAGLAVQQRRVGRCFGRVAPHLAGRGPASKRTRLHTGRHTDRRQRHALSGAVDGPFLGGLCCRLRCGTELRLGHLGVGGGRHGVVGASHDDDRVEVARQPVDVDCLTRGREEVWNRPGPRSRVRGPGGKWPWKIRSGVVAVVTMTHNAHERFLLPPIFCDYPMTIFCS